jgi:hypothetical protein
VVVEVEVPVALEHEVVVLVHHAEGVVGAGVRVGVGVTRATRVRLGRGWPLVVRVAKVMCQTHSPSVAVIAAGGASGAGVERGNDAIAVPGAEFAEEGGVAPLQAEAAVERGDDPCWIEEGVGGEPRGEVGCSEGPRLAFAIITAARGSEEETVIRAGAGVVDGAALHTRVAKSARSGFAL